MTATVGTSAPGPAAGVGPDSRSTSALDIRRSALVAGLGILLLAVLSAVANFGAIAGPVSEGDAARTARDVLAASGWFRSGIAALVVVVILDAVVAWALLTFFDPVHRRLALLAAWLRLAYAAVFAVAISHLAGVLPLLTRSGGGTSLSVDQRNALALLKIQAFRDTCSVALVFFGAHLVLIGYLAYRSGYVPRPLGVLLVVAGLGYLIDSFVKLLAPGSSVTVSVYTFVGEALFMLWLLIKGRRLPGR
jgi:Domain of unknown function (DUF4386)